MKKMYGYIEQYFPYFMFIMISVVMLLQVAMRTFFGISFSWSIELSQYMNVWLTFVGIAYLRKIDAHIRIEMFSNFLEKRLPKNISKGFIFFKKTMNIIFMILLIWFGFEMSRRTWNLRSPAIQIRQTFLYMCVPIGAAGYFIRDILDLIAIAKKDREEKV
ncbi:MAG: TRAP transporter small permease [Spirochaetia bacterium]|nr:TRAP transporter small permease [Spirochaetia bacterium]